MLCILLIISDNKEYNNNYKESKGNMISLSPHQMLIKIPSNNAQVNPI